MQPVRFQTGLPEAAARVAPAIAEAAARAGVDFRTLFETARLESGFNPEARARTSSATGLFQFIEASWLETLARHGERHGIRAESREQALALRTDPTAAALMAAEHMADNGRVITGALGRTATAVDLYLAHFLGAGGAVRFLKELASDPGRNAAASFPSAARANRPVFFEGGAPRSLAGVHALIARKLGLGTEVPHDRAAPMPVSGPRPAVEPMRDAPGRTSDAAAARRAAQAAYLILAGLGG